MSPDSPDMEKISSTGSTTGEPDPPECVQEVTPEQAGTPAPGGRLYEYLHAPALPLEKCLDAFWRPAMPLESLPGIPPPPEEPFEILKRLGPSPFEGSNFPLIGFFASAYERVSRVAHERTRP